MLKRKQIFAAALVIAFGISAAACGTAEPVVTTTEPSLPTYTQATTEPVTEPITEEIAGIPFATKYMELCYPEDLEGVVQIRYEELEDGQQIVFTTDFTGEELELFSFSISASGTEGYELGVLNDPEAGELKVCVDVQEYTDGSWTPEQYTKLNELQERVNDIIIQFHDDPRFTASRP